MTNPLTDPYLVLSQVYGEGKYLKRALADTPVEPLNRARTVKICYGVLEKDLYLSAVIAANCEKQPRAAVRLVLKIALYMLIFLKSHPYMAVDCAVELVRKLGKEGAAGFVNAFLRSYKLPESPSSADEKLAFETSSPLWLAKRLRRSYKAEAYDILSTPSPGVCVRFERNAEKYLSSPHIPTPFENYYVFSNFTRDEGFFAGDYTFQSIGSAAVCAAVEPCERLLDACAAPGGKSAALAKKCGEITAGELYPHRKQLIDEYFARMGVKNARAQVADATVFEPSWENKFDGVLCDCPCTGTGVINENPDIKLFRNEESVGELAENQLKILENCARYVKKGGTLYYSTCSVLPEENDSVAHNFSERNGEFEIKKMSSPLGCRQTKYGLQFLPHISMGAGFYLAAFTKK